jgi:hypothetical protein
MGVDQGCPLSPALFAIGIAGPLERINTKLARLSPTSRVFSYLDDVMVVVPSDKAEEAMQEQRLGDVLDEGQREQCFLRLADGGLGFNSALQAQEAAYLGSWALTLKDVASSSGVSSWQTFRARCAPLAASLDEAEAKMIEQSDGMLQAVDWVGLLSHPQGKLQSFWSAKLKETRKEKLMQELDQDDRVDLRSAGGPGAGGFLEVPTPFEDEVLKPMPEKHFSTMLQDRMRLQICPDNRTCQHRKQNGDLCGEPLDRRGKHALKCECGPSRTGRHDALRDCTANFHPKVCWYVACKEQRVTAWDRTNPRTGLLEEARLDAPSWGIHLGTTVCWPAYGTGFGTLLTETRLLA